MLPWEAEFPLKIDWLCWGRGLVSPLLPTIPRRSRPGFLFLSQIGQGAVEAPSDPGIFPCSRKEIVVATSCLASSADKALMKQ